MKDTNDDKAKNIARGGDPRPNEPDPRLKKVFSGPDAKWAFQKNNSRNAETPSTHSASGSGRGLLSGETHIRTHRVINRVAEIPISQIKLLTGLSLDQYVNVVGPQYDPGRESIAVLLKTGQKEYHLIRPDGAEVRVSGSPRGYSLRAYVYEIHKNMIKSALAAVVRCSSKEATFVDIALGYKFLSTTVGLPQQDITTWFGVSQSAVSNRLRLCNLSRALLKKIRETGLSERHARALLHVETDEMRFFAMSLFVERNISSTKAEQLGKILKTKELSEIGPSGYKDIIDSVLVDNSPVLEREKLFYINSLKSNVNAIRKSGIPVMLSSTETDDYVQLLIRLPKKIGPLMLRSVHHTFAVTDLSAGKKEKKGDPVPDGALVNNAHDPDEQPAGETAADHVYQGYDSPETHSRGQAATLRFPKDKGALGVLPEKESPEKTVPEE